LARDPNRCRRRFGGRSHSRSFHHYAATRKKPILRNGPLYPRFNRRTSTSRGKLFYRLAQQAVQVGPAPFRNPDQTTTCCAWWRQVNIPIPQCCHRRRWV
jgi:hypothetical protein